MPQEQVQKQASRQTHKTEDAGSQEAVNLSNDELTAETDELLDEIDSVLEANAQEFVANYIQKGGQ